MLFYIMLYHAMLYVIYYYFLVISQVQFIICFDC